MNNQTKKLSEMKESIEESKVKQNKLEGQKEEALKNLKKEFKCKTVNEGKRLYEKLNKEIEKEEGILDKQTRQLEGRIE